MNRELEPDAKMCNTRYTLCLALVLWRIIRMHKFYGIVLDGCTKYQQKAPPVHDVLAHPSSPSPPPPPPWLSPLLVQPLSNDQAICIA